MYVCTYVYMCVCVYVCMFACLYTCMHVCIHVCMFAYGCMYICTLVFRVQVNIASMHKQIYMHTCIQEPYNRERSTPSSNTVPQKIHKTAQCPNAHMHAHPRQPYIVLIHSKHTPPPAIHALIHSKHTPLPAIHCIDLLHAHMHAYPRQPYIALIHSVHTCMRTRASHMLQRNLLFNTSFC